MSGQEHHSASLYIKIWVLLLVLFAVSVIGPIFEIKWVTLITAFGVAGVKAWIVATRFMHLDREKTYISYIMGAMLLFVVVFFAGVSSDVMRSRGVNWTNQAALDHIEKESQKSGDDLHEHSSKP